MDVKETERLIDVTTEEEAIEATVAVVQLCRENAKYLDRIYKWMGKVGIDGVRARIEDDAERARLIAALELSQSIYRKNPWAGHAQTRTRHLRAPRRPHAGGRGMNWIDIGHIDDIPERGARLVKTRAVCVAVFRTGPAEVFASSNTGPHRGCPLSQGIGHGQSATCQMHNWVFDLNTGQAQGEDARIATHPVRLEAGRILLDPRRTATCGGAAMPLPLAPGSDVALFNRLLVEIAERGALDQNLLAHTNGWPEALAAALAENAAATGLSATRIAAFCQLWIGTERVVTVYSQGVNQSTSGTDKVNAILNCHLATGRIGKPGPGPFSVTGQSNAMGGREVGGLANTPACHLGLEDPDHRTAVRDFRSAPSMPQTAGLKAVDMLRAVGEGRIKALWITHTNPAVSMPEADAVRDAIAGCDFTVVGDIAAETDTARLADVLLPAAAWVEKDGTVTNSDRVIGRQRAVLPPPGQARPDRVILAEVGRRMGWRDAFTYGSPVQIFREHAARSGIAGSFGPDCDIYRLAGLDESGYAALDPVRGPVTGAPGGSALFRRRAVFSRRRQDAAGARHGKATRNSAPIPPQYRAAARSVAHDDAHGAERAAVGASAPAVPRYPPSDAAGLGLAPADLVQVENDAGRAILRARLTDSVRPGDVFAPIHWTGETAPSARIDTLIPARVDPVSGRPESKAVGVFAARAARCAGSALLHQYRVPYAGPGPSGVSVHGVFHPSYRLLQADAARTIGWRALSVIKGGGGEVERHPGKPVGAFRLRDGAPLEATFSALRADGRRLSEGPAPGVTLDALWRGAVRTPLPRPW
jgi:nitrite reductase/ring-hydroxylating ferredoxin subunit